MNQDNLNLGHLEPVKLREVWPNEANYFTPWLAREENLRILGKVLGTALELEGTEKNVGSFRADILCKDETGARVLIENQLERTDHIHFGQLLMYASAFEAKTVVWIAAKFIEEHQSALNWLNRITNDQFHFFGLEIELWRIGESLTAPRFNVICKPNYWSRRTEQRARTIGELSETEQMFQNYWLAFQDVLGTVDGPVSPRSSPEPRAYMRYAIGKTGFLLRAGMQRLKKRIFADLYIGRTDAEIFFDLLHNQKNEIEKEIGFELEFMKPQKRIAVFKDADPEDEKDWGRQHEWLVEKLNELHPVFLDRIKNLDQSSPSDFVQDLDDHTEELA